MDKMRQKCLTIFSWIHDKTVMLYTVCILFLFPLYTHHAYYDLTISKYHFMVYVTLGFGLVYAICTVLKFQKIEFLRWEYGDILFLVFLMAGGISVQFSEYGMDAFTGAMGRHNGLFLYLIYGIALLGIINNAKLPKISLYFMEAAAVIVGSIGILNHFGQDPLHFFWDLMETQQTYFTSTMGHVGTFGAYVGMMFVFSAVSFFYTDSIVNMIWHGLVSIILLTAIISNSTDGAFIAVIILFAFGWIILKKSSMLFRYVFLLVAFFADAWVVGRLQQQIVTAKPVNGISELVMRASISKYGVLGGIILLFFSSLIWICSKKWKISRFAKVVKNILLILLELGIALLILFFIIANIHPEGIMEHSLWDKLRLTDTWGNYRGYIWLKTIHYFEELPLLQKLFGTGPDTTCQIYQQICTESFLTDYGAYFDNAHNEYLQILLTHGIIGAVGFFGWIWLSIVKCYRKGKQNGVFYAIAFAVLSYEGMAVVGINMVHCMGIVIVLLGLGRCDWKQEGQNGKTKKEKQEAGTG